MTFIKSNFTISTSLKVKLISTLLTLVNISYHIEKKYIIVVSFEHSETVRNFIEQISI